MSDVDPSVFRTTSTLTLRFLATLTSLIAAVVMYVSREKFVKATDLVCFYYFIVVNGIVSGYSLLVFALPALSLLWRFIIVLDVVVGMLLTAVNSAALGMAYLEKYGNTHAKWGPICSNVPQYCYKVMWALIAGYIAVSMYLFLSILCIYFTLNPLLLQGAKE
ncbi:hypothetical protein SLE2022_161830 [Rubroshorea leprosula]